MHLRNVILAAAATSLIAGASAERFLRSSGFHERSHNQEDEDIDGQDRMFNPWKGKTPKYTVSGQESVSRIPEGVRNQLGDVITSVSRFENEGVTAETRQAVFAQFEARLGENLNNPEGLLQTSGLYDMVSDVNSHHEGAVPKLSEFLYQHYGGDKEQLKEVIKGGKDGDRYAKQVAIELGKLLKKKK